MIGQHDRARRSSAVERPALDRVDAGSSPADGAVEIRCSSVVEHPASCREDAGSSPVNGSPRVATMLVDGYQLWGRGGQAPPLPPSRPRLRRCDPHAAAGPPLRAVRRRPCPARTCTFCRQRCPPTNNVLQRPDTPAGVSGRCGPDEVGHGGAGGAMPGWSTHDQRSVSSGSRRRGEDRRSARSRCYPVARSASDRSASAMGWLVLGHPLRRC